MKQRIDTLAEIIDLRADILAVMDAQAEILSRLNQTNTIIEREHLSKRADDYYELILKSYQDILVKP